MSNQTKNNNLNYLIDPTFTNVNRLFVLSFSNQDDRTSFSKHYLPKVEIKDFNVLIDGKQFFEIPVKNKEEAYEAIIEMSKNNGYKTSNILDYEYFKDHYKLIAIYLSKQIELENPDIKQQINYPDLKQQINFIGRLEENNATIFFIFEKKEETNGQNNGQYGRGNENDATIKFDAKVIKPNLCDYSVAANINVAFKTCTPFTRCVTHINYEHAETAENLNIIMSLHNLIEYSDNYAESSGSLYQFKIDESPLNDTGNLLNVALDNLTSFKYKASLLGKAIDADGNDRSLKNTIIAVSLKY